MKPAPVDYVRAGSLEHALESIGNDPEAKVLAGGQSLVPFMNLRLARPSVLVDIGGLAELDQVSTDSDAVNIGALVCHRRLELDPTVSAALPLLSEAARHIGHIAIRHRGTIGGSLAHADPAAEIPAVMVALGSTIHVESRRQGGREIEASKFFVSHYTTVLADDEIITWIRVPMLGPTHGWGFVEFARRSGDFALAGAACALRRDAEGRISDIRAVLLAASDTPLVVSDDSANGQRPSGALADSLAQAWTPRATDRNHYNYQPKLSEAALRRALLAAMNTQGAPGSAPIGGGAA